MAQKFGGAHSPGKTATNLSPKQSTDFRPYILTAASLPLLVTGFFSSAGGLVFDLAAFGLLALAFWLLREGLAAKAAYDARSVARRPAVPRLIIGADLCGAGVLLATVEAGWVAAIVYGIVATALCAFTFGIDPLKNKGMDGFDGLANERVADVVDQANVLLSDIVKSGKQSKNQEVIKQTSSFVVTAENLCQAVQSDPRDLSKARKYLTVYLTGARDAARKFVQLTSAGANPGAKEKYLGLLTDLEDGFNQRLAALQSNDVEDLDVEIEVLRERLQRDGLDA